MNALKAKGKGSKGKGKGGKGKGFQGCAICGEEGHWKWECPKNTEKGTGKAKGAKGGNKGKGGGFQGSCFNGGKFGHTAAECWSPAGKGTAKGAKGKGNKGIRSLNEESEGGGILNLGSLGVSTPDTVVHNKLSLIHI